MERTSKKQDLRYVKNERLIRGAFSELLKKKDFDKITVTELARDAEINKGTFYLHYTDIYSLYHTLLAEAVEEATLHIDFYNEFFLNPPSFVRKFLLYSNYEMDFAKNPIFRENSYNSNVIRMLMIASFKKRIYDCGKLPVTVENDVKLDYILSGLARFTRETYPKECTDIIIEMTADSIHKAFPVVSQ